MKLKDFLALGSPESWIVVIYDDEEEKPPFNGYLEDFQDTGTGDYIVGSWEVAETINEDSELWIYVEKPKMFTWLASRGMFKRKRGKANEMHHNQSV